jgi:pimeloyl-ACP methyl ester carboxylesterase
MADELTIPVGGRSLAGRMFLPTEAAADMPGLLFVHGFKSSQQGYTRRAEAAVESLGCACLAVDLGGHGGSSGDLDRLTPLDHLADLRAAYDELARVPGVDDKRIGVCGASYGAYLSVLLAAQRAVRRLLLRAPALYDDSLLRTPWARPRGTRAGVDAGEVAAALRGFQGDVLVLESERDEVIPREVVSWYVNSREGVAHEVLLGAGHALTAAEDDEFIATIVRFFEGM